MLIDETPLSNQCSLDFVCILQKRCVHNPDRPKLCKYNGAGYCTSKIAKVNAMVIELQKLTGKAVKLT
jgi:hypothetical protein